MTVKIPVGHTRGKLITDVTVAELEAACTEVEARLCVEPRHTDKARQKKGFVSAARKLLQQRKFPTGTYATTDDANRALRDAAEVGWLLSPSDQVAHVLAGTAIVIGAFRVDVPLDTFADDEDPKRRVPAKPMLDRIANQLGVSWDAKLCIRTDNGSSPYLRACQAAGVVKEFDGALRAFQAHGEIDLNAGSSLYKAILARYRDSANRGRVELERRRQYILAHADTTARLRAIRQLGLRDTYLPTELEKPFFTARVQFTGQSEDPAAKAVFVGRVADAFLPAADAVFGKRAGGDR